MTSPCFREKLRHKTKATMVGSALRRTRPMLARYDVSPHMVKWWKSQLKDDGQVRWALSDQRRYAEEVASDGRTLSLIGACRRESTGFYLHDQRIRESSGVGGREGWMEGCSSSGRPHALLRLFTLYLFAWKIRARFHHITCVSFCLTSLCFLPPPRLRRPPTSTHAFVVTILWLLWI